MGELAALGLYSFQLKNLKEGNPLSRYVSPIKNTKMKAEINVIKPLINYTDISTTYPNYEIDESVYEIKVSRLNPKMAERLLTKVSVFLELLAPSRIFLPDRQGIFFFLGKFRASDDLYRGSDAPLQRFFSGWLMRSVSSLIFE